MVFSARFHLMLALAIILALASLWQPQALPMSLIVTAVLLAGAALDIALLQRQPLRVSRTCAEIIAQGRSVTVELTIENRSRQNVRCQLRDSPPVAFTANRAPIDLYLRGRTTHKLRDDIRSYQRGEFSFGPVYYRVAGPLGLAKMQQKLDVPGSVYVFPDVSAEGERDLALSLGSALRVGRRPILSRGEGHEFESLREHQRDDDFRSIDWKATARRGTLITRQYQIERDQRMLIMVDLGRLMSPRIGNYRKLDYAISAAVRLAQMALAKGDHVGLLLFSNEIAFHLPPHKGTAQFSAIVRALASAQPRRLEPNYSLVFNYAARHHTRRTLMVCFTDLLDPGVSRELVGGMKRLMPRHLPMTVTISDSDVLGCIRRVPQTEAEVYEHAVANEMWKDYQTTIRSLQTYGVHSVSVPAADLTLATLNRYLSLKQAARL